MVRNTLAIAIARLSHRGKLRVTAQQAQAPRRRRLRRTNASPATGTGRQGSRCNIKLELTITDQTGPGDPLEDAGLDDRRGSAARAASAASGSVRHAGPHVTHQRGRRPDISQDGLVRLDARARVSARGRAVEPSRRPTSPVPTLNQRLTVICSSPGKPLVVSQAVGPGIGAQDDGRS